MILQKNVASQKLLVYAYDAITGAAVTGDSANITAYISKDGGNGTATDDVNPTEVTDMAGFYAFSLAQAETNCNNGIVTAVSTTGNTLISPVYFSCLTQLDGIESDMAELLGISGKYEYRSDFTFDSSNNLTGFRYRTYAATGFTPGVTATVCDLDIVITYADGVRETYSVNDHA